jgi:putative Mg2+ transporter-C (MgtC) family protein
MNEDFVIAVTSALILGSLVGVERQWHRRLVDLKTNALVALGACLFVWTCRTASGYQDPIRMAGQIVVGVGFIGGGLLFRDGKATQGVNTATTLWCCAAVGVLCGLTRWPEALFASVVIVVANTLLRNLAHLLNLKMGVNDYLTETVQLELVCSDEIYAQVRVCLETFLSQHNCQTRHFSHSVQGNTEHKISYNIAFEHDRPEQELRSLEQQLHQLGVNAMDWQR